MPRHEWKHTAGQPLSSQVKDLVTRYFDEKAASRLERLGGRLAIVLTVPFNPRRKADAAKRSVDAHFVDDLRSVQDDVSKLRARLESLSVKELQTLAGLAGLPLRTKVPRQRLLEEVASAFHGQDVWRRIVGEGSSAAVGRSNRGETA